MRPKWMDTWPHVIRWVDGRRGRCCDNCLARVQEGCQHNPWPRYPWPAGCANGRAAVGGQLGGLAAATAQTGKARDRPCRPTGGGAYLLDLTISLLPLLVSELFVLPARRSPCLVLAVFVRWHSWPPLPLCFPSPAPCLVQTHQRPAAVESGATSDDSPPQSPPGRFLLLALALSLSDTHARFGVDPLCSSGWPAYRSSRAVHCRCSIDTYISCL